MAGEWLHRRRGLAMPMWLYGLSLCSWRGWKEEHTPLGPVWAEHTSTTLGAKSQQWVRTSRWLWGNLAWSGRTLLCHSPTWLLPLQFRGAIQLPHTACFLWRSCSLSLLCARISGREMSAMAPGWPTAPLECTSFLGRMVNQIL